MQAKGIDLFYNSLGQFTFISCFENTSNVGANLNTFYLYDQANRLTTLHHRNIPAGGGTATLLSAYNFTYDPMNRIKTINHTATAPVVPDGLSTFNYDQTSQLRTLHGEPIIDIGGLSSVEQVLVLVWQVWGLVGNSGFSGYFSDEIPGDKNYQLSVHAYHEFRAHEAANAYERAVTLINELRRGQSEMLDFDKLELIHRAKFEDLEIQFLNAESTVERQLAAFIRAHQSELC